MTAPLESLPRAEDKRLSTIASVFLLLSIIGVGIEQLVGGNTPRSALVLLFISYFAARTRWYKLATFALLVTLSFPSYLVALNTPTPDANDLLNTFTWIILPLILCSLVYSVQVTILFSIANIALIVLLPFLDAELSFADMIAALGFYTMTSIFIITVMTQRNQLEKDRRTELIENRNQIRRDAEQLKQFADQAQHRADQLTALNEVSRTVSSLQNLDVVIDLIFEQTRQIIPLDVFFIALYDSSTNTISFPIMFDNGKRWDTESINLKKANRIADIVRSGQPLLLNRTAREIQESKINDIRMGDESKTSASVLAVPLKKDARVIGVISAQSYTMNGYIEEHLMLLTAVAQQVTIAIENARMFDQKSKRAERLAILNEIGREISTLSDLPSLMENVYQQIQKVLSVDFFFIGLYDKEKKELSFPLMYDDGRQWDQPPNLVTEETFSGKTILTRKTILVNEWSETSVDGESAPILVGDNESVTKSLMFAPMLFGRETIGVISVQCYDSDAYNEEDINLLSGITHQVAVAIQNTRLLEETKRNAGYLSILNELGRAVSELRELPELLEVIYQQARINLNVDVFFVGLYQSDNNTVSYPIIYDEGIRYTPEPETLTPNSFLNRFLHGEPAILELRAEGELTLPSDGAGMAGNETKKSVSMVTAPLKIGETVIGIISAQSYKLNAYNDSDLKLLKGIASQVSIAIENSRLFTAAQQEITERKKVEIQLRSAETRYRELVERVPVVIYSTDMGPEGQWHYVSPQIENLLGYTIEEWMADPNLWFERVHQEDREYVKKAEEQAVENNERVEMEYRMLTRDGRVLWIHDESLNINTSDTDRAIMQGFLMDITARKQAEFTIKESEEKYHNLFLTADRQTRELALLSEVQNALARELDLSLLIQTVVEAVAKAFGYTFVSIYTLEGDRILLQHQVGYHDVIEEISTMEGVIGRVIRTGKPVLIKDVANDPDFLAASLAIRSEICVPLFNGDQIFGVLNLESSRDYQLSEDDLRVMLILSEQINIAIRRASLYDERAKSLRREQHINEFAHALSSTLDLPDILEKVARVSVALTSAETGTVTLMSEDGTEMINVYSFNEINQLTELIPKGKGLTWQVYENGSPIILENYSEHPDALKDWAESGLYAFMGIPISAGDKKLGVLSAYNRTPSKQFSHRDLYLVEAIARETAIAIQNARLFEALQKELGEHKITQERLLASVDELEDKNAELEKFTYTVSHDLKSPIVTIGGFLGFLEADLEKENYDRIPVTISRIRNAAKKMEQLLNELLELSRIGRLVNPPKAVPFGEVVRDALELVDGQLRESQIEVKVDAEFPVVHVDRIRMVEVLQNLFANASKFMGDTKKPTIEIGANGVDGEHVFFVRDNGVGIAPEFHELIFGLFNKLDQFSDGTGIGLALVKRIIEVHGGRIWVESQPGKGSTFFFTLGNKKTEETK